MKLLFTALAFIAVAVLFTAPSKSFAQAADTVDVVATPAGNINNFIMGDTLASGARKNPNRVYRLARSTTYLFTGTMFVNFPLTLVGAAGTDKPPVIAPAILPDNTSPGTFVSISKGNATFKNLYLLGIRPDQTPTANPPAAGTGGIAITLTGDSLKLVVDNCVFDGWSWEAISYNSQMDKFFITNSKFRNLIHPTSWFYGEALRSNNAAESDSVVLMNNTYFCINGYAYCPVSYNTYTRFEHNTIFLNSVNPFFAPQLTNGVIKNNIFYGTLAQAQTKAEVKGGWFDWDAQGSSTISFDTLSTVGSKHGITEAQRTIIVSNNDYFWPQKLQDFWKTPLMDTLTPPVWMNSRTQGMFSNKTMWPGLSDTNNTNLDPGFNSSVTDWIDSLIHYVTLNRTNKLATYTWNYNPNNDLFGVKWPLPENLAYTNAALQTAGDDGKPLGDLNWFPGQATDVKNDAAVPLTFSISQSYPNPFNPATTISFSIPESGNLSLKIYDIMGREVMTVINNVFTLKGEYKYKVDMNNFSSGIYFYRLEQGSKSLTKKMTLLK